MRSGGTRPQLRELVVEITRALVRLDPEGLETLAASCRELRGALDSADPVDRATMAQEAGVAEDEMKVLAQVLQATRANMLVMRHAVAPPVGCTGYGPGRARRLTTERTHGNN
jgi:hypothetical protein